MTSDTDEATAPRRGRLGAPARGHLAMLLFSGLVGGSFSLGTMAANEIAPVALTAARFAIAASLVAVLAFATTGVPRSAFRAPWRYLVLGALFGSYFVLMFEGLKTASAVSASAVFTLTPVMAAGFGWLLLRQRLTPRIALALATGAAGALWVIFRGDLAAMRAFAIGKGEIIYLFGCAAHALYTPMARRLNRGEPVPVFTLGMLIAGTAVLTAVGWPEIRATDWANLPPIVWVTLAYLSIGASATTFMLLQYATLRLPSSKVMAYTYLTPTSVIAWELALGHDVPPARVALGVGLTAVALVILLKEEPGEASLR